MRPSSIARRAEEHLRASGVADESFWGPEFEFYVFDGVSYENGMNVAGDMSPRIQNALTFSERALAGIGAQLQSGSPGYDPADAADIDQFLDSLALRSNQQIFQEDPSQVGQLVGLFLAKHPSLTPESFSRYFEDRVNRYDYSVAQGLPASLGAGSSDLYINPSELRSLIFSKGGQ